MGQVRKIKKDSKEMEKIKACKGRRWHPSSGLWLLPYSKENWTSMTSVIPQHNIINTKKEISIHIETFYQVPKQAVSKQDSKSSMIVLPGCHKESLLRMEEQLIVNRYQFNTSKNYISAFKEFLGYYVDIKPELIAKENIKSYLLYKINQDGISESTQNVIINAIKFYYEKVEKRERFVIYDLRPRKAKKLPSFLSKEEIVCLVKAVENTKHRVILKLIYSAGLRLGELIRLKLKDIRWDIGHIMIKCSKGKKDRMVTLSQKLIGELQEYITKFKPRFYLIEGQDGGNYSPRSVQNIFHKAIEISNIQTHATVHTLRHSYATHMIQSGIDIRIVQELLGHASIKTTEIYTHITDRMKSAIKSPLDDLEL